MVKGTNLKKNLVVWGFIRNYVIKQAHIMNHEKRSDQLHGCLNGPVKWGLCFLLLIAVNLCGRALIGQPVSYLYAQSEQGVSVVSFKADTTTIYKVELVAVTEAGEYVIKTQTANLKTGEKLQVSEFTGFWSCYYRINNVPVAWGVYKKRRL